METKSKTAAGAGKPGKRQVKAKTKKAAADALTPNIQFVGKTYYYGKDKKKISRTDEPITKIFGAVNIKLPNASDQKANPKFYHERAREIVRAFPHLYKLIIPKKGK